MSRLLILLTTLACALRLAATTTGVHVPRVIKLDGTPPGTTILQCRTDSGPVENPSWTKDDVGQSFPARITAHDNGTLVFSPTLPSDEGRWCCNGGTEYILFGMLSRHMQRCSTSVANEPLCCMQELILYIFQTRIIYRAIFTRFHSSTAL